MTTPRRRRRGFAEQSYWDQLSARERVAFTLGFHVGQTGDFPSLASVDRLRAELGDDRTSLCTSCRRPLPPPRPGAIGRPPKKCPTCRSSKR